MTAVVAKPLEVVADGTRAGPLALVVVGRPVQRGSGQLEVVAEDAVVADAKAAEAGPLALGPLQVSDPGPRVADEGSGLVECARPTGPDHPCADGRRWRVDDRPLDLGDEMPETGEALGKPP